MQYGRVSVIGISDKDVHADQTGLADIGGNELAAELDGSEQQSEVSRGFLVVLDLVLKDMASEGDEVGLGGVGHGVFWWMRDGE